MKLYGGIDLQSNNSVVALLDVSGLSQLAAWIFVA
jgi:hypothetical protein